MTRQDLLRKLSPGIVSGLLFILCAAIQTWGLNHTKIGPPLYQMHPFVPFNLACIYLGYRFGLKVAMAHLGLSFLYLMYIMGLEFTPSVRITALVNTLICGFFIEIFARLRKANQRERDHRQAQSDFMAMLAHELKSPLAALEATTHSIGLLTNSEIIEGRLQSQRRAIDDIAAILNRLLEVDAVDGGRYLLEPKSFQVKSLIFDIIDDIPSSKKIELNCLWNETITSDPVLLRRVVTNLIDNALKYGPPEAPVKLTVAPERHHRKSGIAFRCTNKIGHAGSPDAKKVFTKYYRASNAKRQSGAGLGLWLVKCFVEAMSGDIRLEQGIDEISFYVWVPDLS
jgi:signal transduction histidine kinase